MDTAEATALITGAVPPHGGIWADLGAGTGLFTRALAHLLGATAQIYAVDRDASALRQLARGTEEQVSSGGATAATVITVVGDFLNLPSLSAFSGVQLDGILLANALHFVAEPKKLLADLADLIRPGGRVVIVEYDDRPASRWVPYPVSRARLKRVLPVPLFSDPVVVGTQPSRYGGLLYAAVAMRKEHPR